MTAEAHAIANDIQERLERLKMAPAWQAAVLAQEIAARVDQLELLTEESPEEIADPLPSRRHSEVLAVG
jgi:hypothetical protein